MSWMLQNEQRIRKALEAFESGAFAHGGALNPEQAKQFLRIIRDNTAALGAIRLEEMDRLQKDIDKLFIGEPVSEHVLEGHGPPAANEVRRPVFARVQLDCNNKKIRSVWPATTEALQTGIERGRQMEQTLFESAVQKVGDDQEFLFWQGDTAFAGGITPAAKLLETTDGIGKISRGAHILDAEGAVISHELFAVAIRTLPKHVIPRPDLRWWMSVNTAIDWMSVFGDRQTGGGDAAIEGRMIKPYGIPIFSKSYDGVERYGVPHIPSDLPLPVSTDSPAYAKGVLNGPFTIDATPGSPTKNNLLELQLDGVAANVVITLPAGVWTVSEIAGFVNEDLAADVNYGINYAHVASNDGFGHLVFESPTVGAASNISLHSTTPAGEQAYTTFGFPSPGVGPIPDPMSYDGETGASGDAVVYEGSWFLLSPAKLMIMGLYTGPAGGQRKTGLRVYSDFRPEEDTLKLFIYWQTDVKVENLDAMVRVDNVRQLNLA